MGSRNSTFYYKEDDFDKPMANVYDDGEHLSNFLHWEQQSLQHILSEEPNRDIYTERPELFDYFRTLNICVIYDKHFRNTVCDYISPQIRDLGQHHHQCKIHSFKILFWELSSRMIPCNHLHPPLHLTNNHIFKGNNHIVISEIQIPNSDLVKKLIKECTKSVQRERTAINEIFSDIRDCVRQCKHSTLNWTCFDKGTKFDFAETDYAAMDLAAIDLAVIEIRQEIGRGNFGVTFEATCYFLTIAVKKFKYTIEEIVKQRGRQLMLLSHCNVVPVLGIALDGEFAYLLTKYLDGGTLLDYVHNKMLPLNVDHAFSWMISLAKAIEYILCVENLDPRVICNLKPKNLKLMDNNTLVTLCNFCIEFDDSKLLKNNLDKCYIAPEVLKDGVYTEQSVVYTYGIIFWEVLARKSPFEQYQNEEYTNKELLISNAVKRGIRPPIEYIAVKASKPLEIFIKNCWHNEPAERHRMDELVAKLKDVESDTKKLRKPRIVDFKEIKLCEYVIGKSEYGIVYRAEWRDIEIGLKKYIKVCKNNIRPGLVDEITLLSSNAHDNIVRLYGITYDSQEIAHLLMEYTTCGSLYNYLHGEEKRDYTISNSLHWMYQAAKGIEYLLRTKIITGIHGNLNSQNMLLFNNFTLLKISDYCFPADEDAHFIHQNKAYVAPEVLDGNPHTKESDVYSFGIVVCEVFSHRKPFYQWEEPLSYTNLQAIIEGERPDLSDLTDSKFNDIKEIIESCWAEPEERPTIMELIDLLNNPGEFKKVARLEAEVLPDVQFEEIDIEKESVRKGTFGNIYKANWHQQQIAVQRCTRESFEGDDFNFDCFVRVVRNLIRVRHENIAELYGMTIHDNKFFILMNYPEGISLHKYLYGEEEFEYTVARALNWMIQCAKGLAYLHAMTPKLVIHERLRPYNLLLLTDDYRILKIFGIQWSKRNSTIYDVENFGSILAEVFLRTKAFTNFGEGKITDFLTAEGIEPIKKIISRCWSQLNSWSTTVEMKEIASELTDILIALDPLIASNLIKPTGLHKWPQLSGRRTSEHKDMTPYSDTINIGDIDKYEEIGRGSFGSVCRAKWGNLVIGLKEIKLMPKSNVLTKFNHEVKMLSLVDHENIVKLYGTTTDSESVYILMEYADCGSLYGYLHDDEQRSYKVSDAIDWMIQTVKAITYMHGKEPPLIHRDLKTSNLLLTKNFKHLMIGDFGTVRELATTNTSEIGTPSYVAPEVLKGKEYTEKCDIYSFGIILWEVMSRRRPFDHLENSVAEARKYLTLSGERPDLEVKLIKKCDPLLELIEDCWHQEPDMRPSAKSIDLSTISCFDKYII
ncbi:uncharacterized protein LOC116806157 [Drosophila grimshawi]|uniref:uncharacterized protein LOC116806157 n=1 Tax=Drosophila grimshawi TaxID=7222 RepID=UPI001C93220C|nr:uncharacterized protein LOC116806157 [Drosophila grimshawi]